MWFAPPNFIVNNAGGSVGNLESLFSRETRQTQPSPIRDICSLVARPEVRSLAGGWPSPAVFPAEQISLVMTELLAAKPGEMLQYGSTEGLTELRSLLIGRMEKEGVAGLGLDDVLITHGSAQGMSLAAQVFVDPEDVVLVGLPTYFGGPGAVRSRGGRLVGVPVDEDGFGVPELARMLPELVESGRRIKGVYVIPNFQNPTGVTLSLERRRMLLDLAEEYGFIIFEDDPYCELRYEGRSLPSLLALDRRAEGNRVIQFRSLSKTFTPGFRLGWVTGPAPAVRRMAVAKQYVDAATNTPGQFLLAEFIRRGLLDEGIKNNLNHYRAKRDFMLEQLAAHFPPEVKWNRPAGGFFIFVHLPADWDAAELFREAAGRDVAFITGQPFFVDGSGKNTLRLSFSQSSHQDIAEAVAELGRLIKKRLGRG